ncbi:uncharacterized protein LOC134274637, partial [Saccostrea cucullata]|uniref:uncharacterized protein LOC134274637 n=1 Tax=Saccostrea cuccullata TaxID=36930 RepID=UPI002ED4658C
MHELVLYQLRKRQLPVFFPYIIRFLKEIKEDAVEIKHIMDNIRTSMKTEGDSLKNLVDTVMSENMKQLDQIEQSLLENLNTQDKTTDDYIAYLNNLVKELHRCLSSTEPQKLKYEKPKILSIPETTKPVKPRFTAGQYSKDDITNYLLKEDRKKSDKKQTLSLSSSVTKVRKFNVPSVDHVYHVSLAQSDRLWISDNKGTLIQIDLQGNEIQKIKTSGGVQGYHTVIKDGDLIFTDRKLKVINRIKQDNNITEFIETGNREPLSIHTSRINGDFLLGMAGKVARYNKTGTELQNIQRDNDGQGLFSYTGQKSEFCPYGICTDVLGHILVCDTESKSVHLLDQDGRFLSLLLTQQQGVRYPRSVCVDDENNYVYVGQYYSRKLTVTKLLKRDIIKCFVLCDLISFNQRLGCLRELRPAESLVKNHGYQTRNYNINRKDVYYTGVFFSANQKLYQNF